jgi:glycerol-3-phosphate O-acyltransferase
MEIKLLEKQIENLSIEIVKETLKEIRDDDYTIEPSRIESWERFVTGLYATLNAEMREIEKQYPFAWRILREQSKSDKSADLEYDATKEGQRRIELKHDLKSLERLSSSLKRTLDRINQERFNTKYQ